MGERKVLNKYYPPDFDPSKLRRVRLPKNHQNKVRTMLSMSIRCKTCGNYVYQGTKFNMRKEDVVGEKYLGLKIFRFYFKCTMCSAELTVKTDPQNSDYVVEAGARRNFEPWREEDEEADKEKEKREFEELGDAMKSLENRTLDLKRKMDKDAALDEMMSMKSRRATVSVDEMLMAMQQVAHKEERLEEEDEAVLKSIEFHNSKNYVRRIHDDDLLEPLSDTGETSNHLAKRQKLTQDNRKPTDSLTKTNIFDSSSSRGKQNGSQDSKIIFKSPTIRLSAVKKPEVAKVNNSNNGSTILQSLCQNYNSDDDDE